MKNKFLLSTLYCLYIILLIFFLELTVRYLASKSSTVKLMSYSPFREKDFNKIKDIKTLHKSTDCSLQPGQIYDDFIVNSHGFLSPEIPYKKNSDEYRIVFLGDSFAVGTTPFKYNFTYLTQKELNQAKSSASELRFQIVNLGMPCVGTSIYLKQLEIEGIHYRPDLIILGFFVGNDFTDDNYNKETINKANNDLKNNHLKIVYQSRLLTILVNLYKTNFFRSYKKFVAKERPSEVLGTWNVNYTNSYDPFEPRLDKEKYLSIEEKKLAILESNSYAYNNVKTIEKNLLRVKNIAQTNNAKLFVLIIPTEFQVNHQLYNEIVKKKSASYSKNLNKKLPQQILSRMLNRLDIESIDLLPLLLKETNPEKFYQPQDTHFNSLGNAKIAAIISDYIQNRVLLPNN